MRELRAGSTRVVPVLLALAAALAGCATAPAPRGPALAHTWQPSPNFDERRVQLVVIHYTAADNADHALRTLTRPGSGVSAHYLIERDGRLVQLVDERARAWHAGASQWGPARDVNSASIGIELDNDGSSPYPAAQIASLLRLLGDLRERHRLGAADFVGHSDVAPGRKVDPGPLFPWRTLAAAGFGLWCEPPLAPAPSGFDAWLGLRAIGYDVRRPDAALAAFRLHHRPEAPPDEPIERDGALIHCLAQASGGS
ncbi:N-acetylmuramoyl-L-alanine amidase [Piscinibacter koreensis]|uniref:N-acetylmuramoyl-L-alanine amidase n=1 Tax=Piscinibacter koreensis TaxID=2742824 RepID=A0A7Y6NR69_9BURK|nr:N-acetylmuramoyl-L-alanine amidase [Schlegelella koreensis]NUZ07809.1 N-acetylmuramoyl-L-alanine amidase [Schlegelella koreensis]